MHLCRTEIPQKQSTGLFLRKGSLKLTMSLGGKTLVFPPFTPFSAFLSRINVSAYSFHCIKILKAWGISPSADGDEGAALDPRGGRSVGQPPLSLRDTSPMGRSPLDCVYVSHKDEMNCVHDMTLTPKNPPQRKKGTAQKQSLKLSLPKYQKKILSSIYALTSVSGILTCCMESRSRTVTQPSVSVSKSYVMQNGVPISS